MTEWQRVGDWDFAPFGSRTLTFRRSDNGASYAVRLEEGDPAAKQRDQPDIVFTVSGVTFEMPLNYKEISPDGVFRLSGGLTDPSDALQIDGHAWTELLLTRPAVISYFGAGVLLRQDTELEL